MERCFTVSFFGHRILHDWDTVEKGLEKIIWNIIECHDGVIFLVGRDGDFDHLVASTVRRLKHQTDRQDISLIWVMPYAKADFVRAPDAFYEYYDEIEICDKSASAHPKAAYSIRNRDMIDRSDLVIFYMGYRKGGTYQSYNYAIHNNKRYVNIYEHQNIIT